jgi:hypothetical protein
VSVWGGGPYGALNLDALSQFTQTVVAPQNGWGFLTYHFTYDSASYCGGEAAGTFPCSDLVTSVPRLTLSLNEAIVDVPISGTGQLDLQSWVDFSKPITITSDLIAHYDGPYLIDLQTTITLDDVSPQVSSVPELSSLGLLATLIVAMSVLRLARARKAE